MQPDCSTVMLLDFTCAQAWDESLQVRSLNIARIWNGLNFLHVSENMYFRSVNPAKMSFSSPEVCSICRDVVEVNNTH